MSQQTVASLFSGGGGFDLGAMAAGLTPAWGIERDPQICEVYRANIGDCLNAAVEEVDPHQLEAVDWLHASSPCINFSTANVNRKELGQDLVLAESICRYIEVLQPRWFSLENVEAYRRSRSFWLIVNCLHLEGYWTHWETLNAADYGVPQTRRRLVLRAIKEGFLPTLPQPEPWIGWYEAIADLIPGLPESYFAPWQLERMGQLQETSLVEVKQTIRPCTVRTRQEPSPTVTADWMRRPVTTPRAFIVDDQYGSRTQEGGRKLSVRSSDQPMFTLPATADHRPYRAWLERGRVVVMTPRALARLQTFEDSYELPERNPVACRIIGNACPPLMFEQLIASTLEGIEA